MMDEGRNRWLQRLENFGKAMENLESAIALADARELSDLEKGGLIQYFEVVWDLGWKVMVDFLEAHQTPAKSRTATMAIRGAVAAGVVIDGDAWIAAGNLRHALSHTYSKEKRDQAVQTIERYFRGAFRPFQLEMLSHAEN